MDYKSDILLSNLRDNFKKFSKKSNSDEMKDPREYYRKSINQNINLILPEKMKTGTSIDEIIFKGKGSTSKLSILDINNILEFEIFPSLITQFCLTQNYELEKKILNILGRFYNQRNEFAEKSASLLLLFDEENIKVLQSCKLRIKHLARNVDESEVNFT